MDNNSPQIKIQIPTPQQRPDLDLLELVCELHSRALNTRTEAMHNHYWEARKELEKRLTNYASQVSPQVSQISDEEIEQKAREIGFAHTNELHPKYRAAMDMADWMRDRLQSLPSREESQFKAATEKRFEEMEKTKEEWNEYNKTKQPLPIIEPNSLPSESFNSQSTSSPKTKQS